MRSPRTGSRLIHTFRHIGELRELRSQWLGLWRGCADVTAFQSPCWLIPWWEELGGGAEIRATAIWENHELIGLLPLILAPNSQNARVLSLMGTGVSDYLGGLFMSDPRRIANAALQESLIAHSDWDICDLQELRLDSPLLNCPLAQGFESETAVQSVCPYLDLRRLQNDGQDFIPAAMRKRLRRYGRVLHNAAKIDSCHSGNLEAMLQSLVELHQSRWAAQGRPGMFAEPSIVRFHQAAASGLEESGALRLYRLTIEGRVAAAFYGFSSSNTTFGYLQGFDPEMARFSAGTVLLGHAVEQARFEGNYRFDFLRGTEDYKYSWGAQNGNTYRRKIYKGARAHSGML